MNNVKYPISAVLHKTCRPTLLSGDAASAAALLEKPEKSLWYLAYGSNLNSSVFKGNRRVRPLEERHVLVEGLELTFDLPGLPYVEPRFANCRFTNSNVSENGWVLGDGEKSEDFVEFTCDVDLSAQWTGKGALIGVAYLVTAEDFARVIKTEGGGSGYKMVSVRGRVFRRKVKLEAEEESFEFTGETADAFTLLASGESIRTPFGQASSRYLKLIQEGAKQHNLPTNYIAYLDSLAPFSARTFRQKLGAAVFVALCGPAFIVLMILGLTFAHKDGSYPRWINRARGKIMRLMWRMHDSYTSRLFGDGERTANNDT